MSFESILKSEGYNPLRYHEEAEENEEGGELVSSHCLKNTHDNYSDGFSNHKACKDGSGVLDTLHDVFFIVESHIVLAIFS